MGLLRNSLMCIFLLIPALGCAQEELIVPKMESSPPVLSDRVQILADKNKKKYEFVEINGEMYPVPKPWLGRKIEGQPPQLSDLKQIPVAFTHNESKLFLEKEACDAFVTMAEKAQEDDIQLRAHSGFRSTRYQRVIFGKLMAQGRTWEDLVRYVAPPGYSEHLLGRAVDLYPSNWRFAATREYLWLQENGAKFGFTETYPEVSAAGFPWESWHWSYIGESEKVADKDITSQ